MPWNDLAVGRAGDCERARHRPADTPIAGPRVQRHELFRDEATRAVPHFAGELGFGSVLPFHCLRGFSPTLDSHLRFGSWTGSRSWIVLLERRFHALRPLAAALRAQAPRAHRL